MNTSPQKTALVLGGAGAAGNAWTIGVIAGLAETGLDVSTADLIIGTSAGSTAAAQITGASAADLYDSVFDITPRRQVSVSGAAPQRPAANRSHIEASMAIIDASIDPADMRRRMGERALAADTDSLRSQQWRQTVAARLPNAVWPENRMLITAVDAVTGDPVVFDRNSGVDLVDAVAASCSSGPAYRIGDRRFIDGGYRSNAENADLAAGFERVIVLSPFGGRSLYPAHWGTHLADQVEGLRANGSMVQTIFPDSSVSHIFAVGGNVMDHEARPVAARAGRAQALALAPELEKLWR